MVDEIMAKVLIKMKAPDFDKWKSAFDEFSADRKLNGSKGGLILHNSDDPNMVFILLEWDDLNKAQKFYGPQSQKRRQDKGEVSREPEVYFFDEVEKTSS